MNWSYITLLCIYTVQFLMYIDDVVINFSCEATMTGIWYVNR